jgi:hypothetical protein
MGISRARSCDDWGRQWFELDTEGPLGPARIDLAIHDASLVTVPEERVAGFLNLMASGAANLHFLLE